MKFACFFFGENMQIERWKSFHRAWKSVPIFQVYTYCADDKSVWKKLREERQGKILSVL